jgi:hypothetical protein
MVGTFPFEVILKMSTHKQKKKKLSTGHDARLYSVTRVLFLSNDGAHPTKSLYPRWVDIPKGFLVSKRGSRAPYAVRCPPYGVGFRTVETSSDLVAATSTTTPTLSAPMPAPLTDDASSATAEGGKGTKIHDIDRLMERLDL